MKLKRLALLFLVSAFTGCAGYYVGVLREPSVTYMPQDAVVSLDYLGSVGSFSEVEHARAALDALAARYAAKAQGLISQEILSRTPNLGMNQSSSKRPMLAAIQLLEEAIPEFRGTGAELQLLQPLLYALKREQLFDRWLDVYLEALYQHPTHEMVSALAEEAAVISQAAGRQREFTLGLRYLGGIPANMLSQSRLNPLIRVHANTRTRNEIHEQQL